MSAFQLMKYTEFVGKGVYGKCVLPWAATAVI